MSDDKKNAKGGHENRATNDAERGSNGATAAGEGGEPGQGAGAGAHLAGPASIESVLRSLVSNPSYALGNLHPLSHPQQHEKVNTLISMIENTASPAEQLTGLSQLCEHVSIASEDSMMSFPTDRVIPLLLEELKESEDPDVMLLAARAVTLLLDVYPPSARLVCQHGGVGVFCEKLLSIEYIDLAEQSIQALGKMSDTYPGLLLDTSHGNVLDAVLLFIDFFQVGMQRIAVATAANVCRAMASADGYHVMDRANALDSSDTALDALKAMFTGSIPALLQLTTSSDNKIALSAYQALTSVAKCCVHTGVPVESIIDVDRMQRIVECLVAVGINNAAIKPCVFYAMTQFVSAYTLTSVEIPKRLLDHQAPCIVANILALLSTKAQASSSSGGITTSLKDIKPRNQDEIFVLLSLVDNMLPPVLASDLRVFDRSKTKREMKTLEAEGLIVRDSGSTMKNLESFRAQFLGDSDVLRPCDAVSETGGKTGTSSLDTVAPMMLDALLHLEFATLSRDAKVAVLSVVDKILFFSSSACLTKLVVELPVSVFVIRLLQSSNHVWPLNSLKFVAIMLQKQPDLKRVLLREGILHEVKKTKEAFLGLGEGERDLSAAFAWFADRVLTCSFGENVKKSAGVGGDDETEGMVALRALREAVAADPGDTERILASMGGFFKLVLDRAVSPYEIHASGILEDVHTYLSSGAARKNDLLALLGSPEATERLIDTIQEILMNSEHLQVIKSMAHAVPSIQSMLLSNLGLVGRAVGMDGQEDDFEGDQFVNGLRALGSPLRIKLYCLEEALRNRLSGTTILIEPLATIAQTEEYLRPKIFRLLTPELTEQIKNASENATNAAGEKVKSFKDAKDTKVNTRSKAKRLGYPAGMGGSKQEVDGDTMPASPSFSDDSYEECGGDMAYDDEDAPEELDSEDVDMIESDVAAEAVRSSAHRDKNANDAEASNASNANNTNGTRETNEFSIKLFLDGRELKASDTLLRVLHTSKFNSDPVSADRDMAYLWKETHRIDVRLSFDKSEASNDPGAESVPMDIDPSAVSLRDVILSPTSKDPADSQVYYAVRVLQMFEDSKGASSEYRPLLVNSKICSKLTKQMKDPLLVCSRTLPDWCSRLPYLAKFLFSYESRRMYFRYHAFGLGRTMLSMLEDASGSSANIGQDLIRDLPFRAPRIVRQKVRISRSHVLESSRKVFERYAEAKCRLEVEFYNEAGSGLGPTLEFYTLLSTELQRRDLGMWRDAEGASRAVNDGDPSLGGKGAAPASLPGPKAGELPPTKKTKELVSCPFGLFPRPVPSGKVSAALKGNFKLLGQAAAKAIQDGRLLDIPLSRPFYKLALLGPRSLDRADLADIDPDVHKTLSEIQEAVTTAALSTSSASTAVLLKGVPIDELFLSFVLPGDDTYELQNSGADVTVTSKNAAAYVQGVYDALLDSGVVEQMAAFREGFNQIFPLKYLGIFYEDEIEAILCGDAKETWTPESLTAAIKCDHGYLSSSPPVIALIDVLSNLDPVDKRRFLKFVTGAPRLPAGGWSALKPRFTVVRKNPDLPSGVTENTGNSENIVNMTGGAAAEPLSPKTRDHLVAKYADKDLPSVMTCANYLKLPPYSSPKVLRDRLLYSIREGQNSFDLS